MKVLHNLACAQTRIKGVLILWFCTAILASTCLPMQVGAEIHRWKDEQGYWHFSEGPGVQPQIQESEAATPAAEPRRQSAQAADGVSALPPGAGLLWRISTAGRKPSYLLGTIHSDDPRVTRLKQAVVDALDGCDRFVMEMVLDTEAFMQFGATMLLEQGTDLEHLVGKDLYDQIVPAMAGYGMPEPVVRRLKPWVVVAMLGMPKSNGGLILDMVLYQRATSQGKPASGLESAKEQLAVFEDLSVQDQIELLEMTLKQQHAQSALFEQLIAAYAADDLNGIADIASLDQEQARSAAARRFMTGLNDDRNRRMVQRIIPFLEQGNSFIAVGALHLAGSQGILSLIRREGFIAEPAP